ncbi:hypothetical protein AB0D27_43355 [Streptomyces sp. NPDC048415]|uniref:hypothetical protein n=1 Tax=Streptomyces sp. NPDC048415 TaxID=3154822 RepID=UPI00341409B4
MAIVFANSAWSSRYFCARARSAQLPQPRGASPCFLAFEAMLSYVGSMSAAHLSHVLGHASFALVKAVFGLQPLRSINCRASSGSTGRLDTM